MLVLLSLLVACSDPPPPPTLEAPPEFDPTPPGADLDAPDTGEPVGDNRAPRFRSIEIQPKTVTTTDTLLAMATVEDPEKDRLDYDYVWIIDEMRRPDLTSQRLAADQTAKGQSVAVEITVDDGTNQVTETSRPVTIGNSAPEFVGDPRLVGQIDGFTLKATDPDDDELTFRMSDQPAGMSIHPTMGRIEYKGSEDEEGGDYSVKITVDDGSGGTAEWSFDVSVSAGSEAVKRKKEAEKAAQDAAEGAQDAG